MPLDNGLAKSSKMLKISGKTRKPPWLHRVVITCGFGAMSFAMLQKPAYAISLALAEVTPVDLESIQWLVQGGGVTMSAYLIWWMTARLSAALEKIEEAVEKNTRVLEHMDARHRRFDEEEPK